VLVRAVDDSGRLHVLLLESVERMTYIRKKDRVKEVDKKKDDFWWLPLLTKSGLADAKAFAKEWSQMPDLPLQQFSNMPERRSPSRKKPKKTK
jgi:hypothetical protein